MSTSRCRPAGEINYRHADLGVTREQITDLGYRAGGIGEHQAAPPRANDGNRR